MDETRAAPVETVVYPSEVTRQVGDTNESGQLELVDVLREQIDAAIQCVSDIEETLNPQIDANPDGKLLMEMLDVVSDASDSLRELSDLLTTMQSRDLSET